MSDEHTAQGSSPDEPIAVGAAAEPGDAGPDTGDAWKTVITQVDELADAIGRWAKAAVNDPDNKRRAQELKAHIERMGDKVSEAVDGASESDAAQTVKDAADKAGDAIKDLGTKVGEEVFPRMASAFESAAGKLHEAAAKMEEKEPAVDTPEGSDDDVAQGDAAE